MDIGCPENVVCWSECFQVWFHIFLSWWLFQLEFIFTSIGARFPFWQACFTNSRLKPPPKVYLHYSTKSPQAETPLGHLWKQKHTHLHVQGFFRWRIPRVRFGYTWQGPSTKLLMHLQVATCCLWSFKRYRKRLFIKNPDPFFERYHNVLLLVVGPARFGDILRQQIQKCKEPIWAASCLRTFSPFYITAFGLGYVKWMDANGKVPFSQTCLHTA